MDWHKLERLIKVKAVPCPLRDHKIGRFVVNTDLPSVAGHALFVLTAVNTSRCDIVITKGFAKMLIKQVLGLKVIHVYITFYVDVLLSGKKYT